MNLRPALVAYLRALAKQYKDDGRHWVFPIDPLVDSHSISNIMGIPHLNVLQVFHLSELLVLDDNNEIKRKKMKQIKLLLDECGIAYYDKQTRRVSCDLFDGITCQKAR